MTSCWQNHYMSEHDFDDEGTGLAEYDPGQLSQGDTLIDRGVADPLDEGVVPPDKWSVAQGYGNTPEEIRRGETLDMRIAQEQPEEDPNRLRGAWNPNKESRQVGTKRAGRLVATDEGFREDTDAESVARDVGISGGAASAEEAAMHIINEADLKDPGEDEPDEKDES